MDEALQYVEVSLLPANELRRSRGQDRLPKLIRFIGRSGKVRYGLRDAPHASVSLAGCTEELNNDRSETLALKQRPAFIENRDRLLATGSNGALRRGVSDEQAHGGLQLRIVFELLHVEVEPLAVHVDRRVTIEQRGIHPVFHPWTQLRRCQRGLLVHALIVLVVEVDEFVAHITERRYFVDSIACATVGALDGEQNDAIENVRVALGAFADH